ncbi:hypothetical protein PRZ48_008829 [Zasmidium cellare]|uniref:Uncharacterized protein n=1 Tax=Zasmidium cellare TaxID=395010 RepID=A0ABR0EHL4_ZASCE|nr:hypothetical protein PRZ48_008829 [Zasmidium cellare]
MADNNGNTPSDSGENSGEKKKGYAGQAWDEAMPELMETYHYVPIEGEFGIPSMFGPKWWDSDDEDEAPSKQKDGEQPKATAEDAEGKPATKEPTAKAGQETEQAQVQIDEDSSGESHAEEASEPTSSAAAETTQWLSLEGKTDTERLQGWHPDGKSWPQLDGRSSAKVGSGSVGPQSGYPERRWSDRAISPTARLSK